MGSTPSRQKDTLFSKPRFVPFQNMGATPTDHDAGMGEGESVEAGPHAGMAKGAGSRAEFEAAIKKGNSRSPGTRVSWSTTSRVAEEVAVNGNRSSDPDYPPQQKDATILQAGHFKATH